MKKIYLILQFLASLLLAGCIHSPIAEQPIPLAPDLLHIDSLMQSSPDSALQMLLSFRADSVISTEAQRSGEISCHYHSLLLSEALYKTDNSQLNRFVGLETCHNASLHDAVHYFDSVYSIYPTNDDLAMLSARSHYMNGVGFYENDSVVEACKEYLHTLDIIDNFNDKDLVGFNAKFIGLTYTRLGELFSNYGRIQQAIDSYKNALTYFSKIPSFSLSNTYRRIGSSYYMDNNIDSALFYYRRAISSADDHNKKTVFCDALSESAQLFYELGYKDSAFMMARKALSYPSNDDKHYAYCFTYGLLLSKEHQYDSAIYYLKQSIKRDLFATRTVSAELLMQCYMALGDTTEMLYYKNMYGDKLDEYRSMVAANEELSKVYESYQQDKFNKVQIELNKKHRFRTFVLSLLTLFAVFMASYIVRKKLNDVKQKSHDDIEEKNRALADMKRKIESNSFINEPICISILDTVSEHQFKSKVSCDEYKSFALDKNQLLKLRDAVDRHYNNFTKRLQKKYPDLSDDDIDYCCLYLLRLKDVDVSALMQRDYSTVCYRKRKIKTIIKPMKHISEMLYNTED